MIDSLFDKKISKSFDKLAKQQAELDKKKRDLEKIVKLKMESETITKVFDIVDKNGHPDEKQLSNKIRQKYNDNQALEFDDYMNLNDLYKSNFKSFSNKGANDE